jgi:hypothetical protein
MDCIFTWAKALDATMIPYEYYLDMIIDGEFTLPPKDITIFIPSKTIRKYDNKILEYKKKFPQTLVGIMQEGPINLFENWTAHEQYDWLNILDSVDFLLTHNLNDRAYIKNITKNKNPTYVLPTLFDGSLMPPPLPMDERRGVMIMGCPGQWYNAMPAIKTCLDLGIKRIGIPGMGRITDDFREFCKEKKIEIYSWIQWADWLDVLKTYTFGINIMTTRAAGTFNLNCAALGLPCIGFYDLDTQINCHNENLYIGKSLERYIEQFYTIVDKVYQNTNDYIEQFNVYPEVPHKRSVVNLAYKYSISSYKQNLLQLFEQIHETCTRANTIAN